MSGAYYLWAKILIEVLLNCNFSLIYCISINHFTWFQVSHATATTAKKETLPWSTLCLTSSKRKTKMIFILDNFVHFCSELVICCIIWHDSLKEKEAFWFSLAFYPSQMDHLIFCLFVLPNFVIKWDLLVMYRVWNLIGCVTT